MEIIDLKPKQGNVEVVAEVIEKGEVREFQKFGKSGRVCTAKIKDDSGEMALTLWNEDINKVNIGDKIRIENGYVSEWQGELQLTTGRFGKLEIIEKGEVKEEETEEISSEEEKEEIEEESKEEPEEEIDAEEEEIK